MSGIVFAAAVVMALGDGGIIFAATVVVVATSGVVSIALMRRSTYGR
jgi:hypothetical protein